jgi:hypothetical protein
MAGPFDPPDLSKLLAPMEMPKIAPLRARIPEMPRIPSIWETQALMYMNGLKAQSDDLLESIGENQDVIMECWYGQDKLRVLEVSMPSDNTVSLSCIDNDECIVKITGHMSALSFSFRVITLQPPAKRKTIGFNAPEAD